MSKETVYSEDPEKMAIKWHKEGAERLHLVDLDGAIKGRPVNKKVIERIAKSVPIPIELGGGIRDIKTIEDYLGVGIRYVILGTVAFKDPDFVAQACSKFPDRIILGIDAKDGHVAVEGWVEETDMMPVEMAKRYEALGISTIIYTDILRDGMGTGPNVEATKNLAEAIHIPVIASGGISGIDDVSRVSNISSYGVMGMITGKALYEGTLDLSEAIGLLKN